MVMLVQCTGRPSSPGYSCTENKFTFCQFNIAFTFDSAWLMYRSIGALARNYHGLFFFSGPKPERQSEAVRSRYS